MKCVLNSEAISMFLKKACGSEESVRNYKPRVERFFQFITVDPDRLVSEWKRVKYDLREREKFIDEWTGRVEQYVFNNFQDCTSKTRMNEMTILVSFFKNCCSRGIPIEPKREKHTFVKYHNRDIRREEIRKILTFASTRDKAFFLMMAESGLRPYTLVNLRYKHIKRDFEAIRVPMMIDLPSELLKGRVEHRWTFIGEDGAKALRTYLKKKLPLGNEDLIFSARRKDAPRKKLTRSTFSMIFAHLAMKLGIVEPSESGKPKQIRLYCLRKYFMNNIRCDTAFREWWMGHKTTQTHHVSRDMERHREEYAKAYRNLRVYQPEQSTSDLRRLLEERDTELAQLKESLSVLNPLLEFIARDPKSMKRLLLMIQSKEKTRLLAAIAKWNKRVGLTYELVV